MAITGTYSFSVKFSPAFHRDVTPASGNLKRNLDLKRLAVSSEQASTSSSTTTETKKFAENGRMWKKSGEEAETARRVNMEESERNGKSLKDYFDEAKDLIRSDAGPPRWFSPLESGSHTPDSPLLLFLPGIDGVGLGLTMQHQRLGQFQGAFSTRDGMGQGGTTFSCPAFDASLTWDRTGQGGTKNPKKMSHPNSSARLFLPLLLTKITNIYIHHMNPMTISLSFGHLWITIHGALSLSLARSSLDHHPWRSRSPWLQSLPTEEDPATEQPNPRSP